MLVDLVVVAQSGLFVWILHLRKRVAGLFLAIGTL